MAKRILRSEPPKILVKLSKCGSVLALQLEHPVYAAVRDEVVKDVRPGSSPYTIGDWTTSFRDNRAFLVETEMPGALSGTVQAVLAEVVRN